jgi:hypothetical protein
MYRYLLTVWLVACTIGYSAAWAFDGHFEGLSQHQDMPGSADHAGDGGQHSSCDHCCHAFAHLAGLWANQPEISLPASSRPWPRSRTLHASILTGPPGHPPRTAS